MTISQMPRVLLVDDDRMLLEALPETMRLRMDGVEVETAEDAAAALARIAVTDYDVIVTDIKMPGMDGLALLAQIRELRPEVPTLLITGHGEQGLAVEALRGGAYDFIQKPIDRDYFMASLVRAVQLRQLRRQVAQQRDELARHASQLEHVVEERTSALRMLADAGRLFASAFDPEAALVSLARMAVPRLGELCVAFLLREDDTLRRLEVAHVDPRLEEKVRGHLSGPSFDPLRGGASAQVLRTGESLFVPDVSPEWLRTSGTHPRHANLLQALGVRSGMLIPLQARGRVLGAVALCSSSRVHTQEDLEFGESLCRRAALAIDNARLYERERTVAETLQRSLLPETLPSLPGVAVAARYLPASPEAVGGDWYDVFPLPAGRMGMVMGDVAGRGVRVAAVMGQLRSVLRAYALEGHPTDVAVKRLTGLVAPGDMATLLYLIFDPAAWTVEFTNAGHLPPLIVSPAGGTQFLEGGFPPLGVGRGRAFRPTSQRIEPGSTIILYTDGLVESRGVPIDEGLQRLARAAAQVQDDLNAQIDRVLAEVLRGVPGADDVALLALRAAALDPACLLVRVPAEPASVARVRHALRRWLEQAGVGPTQLSEISVACCEACSNTVEHAYGLASGDIEVAGSIKDAEVILTIRDWGQWRPPRGINRGRGLPVIEALMEGVEVEPSVAGTTVRLRGRIREWAVR